MSKYTTEVRYICETRAGLDESEGYMSVNDIIKKAAPKIFDFEWPIFDERYRLPLEIKILKHYYTREICAETVGRWKLFLDQKMNEIMPYYNDKYRLKLEALKNYDKLFSDTDITTTRKTDDSGKSQTNTSNIANDSRHFDDRRTTNGTQKNAFSETPQGSLHGVDSLTYLTDYRKIDDTGSENLTHTENGTATATGDTSTNITNTQDYIEHVTGKRGGRDYLKIYQEIYESIINIDLEIINELSDLFFGLW